jgi:hypothetical protein
MWLGVKHFDDVSVLAKVRPENTDEFMRNLRNWPGNTSTGVKLGYTGKIWFDADNPEHAIEFIQNKIRKLPGVTEVHPLPTTPTKAYMMKSTMGCVELSISFLLLPVFLCA